MVFGVTRLKMALTVLWPAGHEPDETHDMAPFVSAPVSRGGDHYVVGGEHEPSASSVRLSKAEREHAAAAGVSDEIYAREKLRMMKLKQSKII